MTSEGRKPASNTKQADVCDCSLTRTGFYDTRQERDGRLCGVGCRVLSVASLGKWPFRSHLPRTTQAQPNTGSEVVENSVGQFVRELSRGSLTIPLTVHTARVWLVGGLMVPTRDTKL